MERLKIILVCTGICATTVEEFDTSDVIKAMEKRGFKHNGRFGRQSLREELRGKPCFTGLVGPCWGGDGRIRYENQAAYDMLSA